VRVLKLRESLDRDMLAKVRRRCISAETCPYMDPLECAKCFMFFVVYIEDALKKDKHH